MDVGDMGVTLEVALGMQTMKGLQPNDRGLQPTMVNCRNLGYT